MDRFYVLGTVEDHVAKLTQLKDMGVDQFNIYLMHDAQEETLDAYGDEIMPALAVRRVEIVADIYSSVDGRLSLGWNFR